MKTRGFTLIEILVVLAVLAILIGISLPMIKGMQDQASIEKARAELKTLHLALESYYMHANPKAYPPSADPLCATYLISATPQMIDTVLHDPFGATADSEYGYLLSNNGKYYAVCSLGPDKTSATSSVFDNGRVMPGGDDLCLTNGITPEPGSVANGDSCTQNSYCQSGVCGGHSPICLTTGSTANGEACGQGSDCQSGYCVNWVCSGQTGSESDSCWNGADCQSGYCIGWRCSEQAGVSTEDNCTDGPSCQSGYCVNRICSELAGSNGDPCDDGVSCESGHCVSNVCAP